MWPLYRSLQMLAKNLAIDTMVNETDEILSLIN